MHEGSSPYMNSPALYPVIGIVSSCGLPLALVRLVRTLYERYPHVYYLTDAVVPSDDMVGRMEVVSCTCQSGGGFFQFMHAWKTFGARHPALVVSVVSREAMPLLLACVGRKIPVLLIQVSRVGCAAWLVQSLPQLIALWWVSRSLEEPLGGRVPDQAAQREQDAKRDLCSLEPRLARWIQDVLT